MSQTGMSQGLTGLTAGAAAGMGGGSGASGGGGSGGVGGGGGGGGRPRAVNVDLGKLFDRLPPNAPEAEMALLGAMILDPKVIPDVISHVRGGDDFYSDANGAIFNALVSLYNQHQAGNLVLLADRLRDVDILKDVGGPEYLVRLTREVPAVAAAPYYAKVVGEKAKLRALIRAAGKTVYDAYHAGELGPEGAREVIDEAQRRLFEIAERDMSSDPQALADLVQLEYDRLEALHGKGVSGVRTHFTDLDELTSGLQPGELIIIAARPSMGKTALALNLAMQTALGGTPESVGGPRAAERFPVGFFSLEMSKSAIAQRLLSAQARVNGHKMRSGRLTPDDYSALHQAIDHLREAPIFVDDTPALTVLMLRSRARRMVHQHNVRAIFIDYLQLMTAPNAARESRQVEVSAISRGIKALARDLNIPVICLSQLNRGPESRENNRPRMSDLRESGSIEQDADVVMLLHREEYYHIGEPNWADENQDKIGLAELIIAKQRNGPTDSVKLKWDPDTVRFKNLAAGYHTGAGYASEEHGSITRAVPAPRSPQPLPAPGIPAAGMPAAPKPPARPSFAAPAAFGAEPAPFDDDPETGIATGPLGGFRVEVRPFSPGKQSGPVANFRDGGGPDKDVDLPDSPGFNPSGPDDDEIPI